MNSHLAKYLTCDDSLLREWVRERINGRPCNVIERNINHIPEPNIYVHGAIDLSFRGLYRIDQKVIYCKSLLCSWNLLLSLPELPVCRSLDCLGNMLESPPDLPYCEYLCCTHNRLKQLPELPVCEKIICDGGLRCI